MPENPKVPTVEPVIVKDDNAGANSEQKIETPKPPEFPAWSKGGKYKTPEDLANANDAAVREMKEKERESAILRRELELERASKTQPATPAQGAPQKLSEEQVRALEDQYGMSFGQLSAMNDLLEMKLKSSIETALTPITESIHADKYNQVKKSVLEKDMIYQAYEPEFEARLNRIPLNKRSDVNEINKVRSEIMLEKWPEIQAKIQAEAIAGITAQPQKAPEIPSGSSSQDTSPKSALTKDQRLVAERLGLNPDEVGKQLSGSNSQSGWTKLMGGK